MPAVLSHYLLAERVYKRLLPKMPELDHDLFLWGANGPDIFFAHRLMPWQTQRSLSKVSHIMHGTSAEIILNYLYGYSKTRNDNAIMSYALGFATHYAYDSAAHPYIVSYADNVSDGKSVCDVIPAESHFSKIAAKIKLNSVYHNKLEGELDTLLLMHERKTPVYKFRLEDTSPKNKTAYRKIAEVLCSYLVVYDIVPDINEHEIIQSAKDWRAALHLLNDKISLKKLSVSALENLIKFPPVLSVFLRNIHIDTTDDPANLLHKPWVSPYDGNTHNESFFDLTDKAEETSVYLIEKLRSGLLLTHQDCIFPFSGKK